MLKRQTDDQMCTHAHKHFFNRLLDYMHLLMHYLSHFTLKSSSPKCNYFLQRTHGTVLFTSCVIISYGTVCMSGCCLYLCSILASSSSCWKLIFTQFFSRWLNTAVRCAAQHLTNTCPSRVAHVSAATLRQAEFVPVYWQLKKFSVLLSPRRTKTAHSRAQTYVHKHKLTSICLPSPSQLVICAKALGVVGVVSAVMW